ncbi:MAG: 23S rRNA (uracil(1939)-C(5))-methyltransferase RlmD [Clostridia bacterium]|nr:23S rRNA (uracil(1939)-C(5))-methyltransferase RlmD [Clostridia bacterium]
MIEKNQIVTAVTEALGSNGEGVIRHEGITFFVPACLPGEKVRFKILKIKDGIGYGKIEEVLTPAEERARAKCPVFSRCGGCSLQHMEYPAQLQFKTKLVRDCLKKIGGIEAEVSSTVKSDAPYGYRNKLQMPIGVDKEGNTVIGFYAERSHRIVPTASCAIHPDWATKLIVAVTRYIKECKVTGYDEAGKSGSLRHIVAREIGGKFLITLVSATPLSTIGCFAEILKKSFEVFSLYLNINAEDTNVIFGKSFQLVHGSGFFETEEQGIRYEAGPQTFLQVNAGVRRKLYTAALKATVEEGDEVVIDAYSGGGLLTAMLAQKAKRVYGIELEKEASACADRLKEKNGLTNMTNICGYVEEELTKVLEKEKGEKLRLILDPPRAGIHRSVVKALIASGIEKLTIISCNPATLARDLGLLTGRLVEEGNELKKGAGDGAYEIVSIQPYDMFPQTKHVESVVCLSRK